MNILQSNFNYKICIIFCVIFSSSITFAESKITLNAGTAEPFINADGSGFYGELVKEAFSKLNIDANVIRLPSSRSILNANKGIDDGVIARTKGFEKKFKNLIRVPVPILRFKFVAYSLDKEIDVKNWDSLKPYSVGYIRGWRIYEKNVVNTKNLTLVQNAEQLFKLLLNKRTDLILFEYYRGSWWNKHLKANAHLIGSPIVEKDMFIYMHKKHAALVPELTKVLTNLIKDGSYQRIKEKTLTKLIE